MRVSYLLVLLMVLALLAGQVFAHLPGQPTSDPSEGGVDEDYRSTFERFFIREKTNLGNSAIESRDNLLDLILYKLGADRYQPIPAGNGQRLRAYLDTLRDDMRSDLEEEKYRLLTKRMEWFEKGLDALIHARDPAQKPPIHVRDEVREDILFLGEVFNIFRSKDRFSIIDLLSWEMSIIVPHMGGKDAMDFSFTCDQLPSSLRFACYKELFEHIVDLDKQDVKDMLALLSSKEYNQTLDGVECHFLNHEVGFLLNDRYGIDGSAWCSDTYDQCSFGCYHGMAENIHFNNWQAFKDGSIMEHESFRTLVDGADTYARFNLIHGFGHAFYSTSQNLTRAQQDCDMITGDDIPRKRYCHYGIAHEMFQLGLYRGMTYDEGREFCEGESIWKSPCFYMLTLIHADVDFKGTLARCREIQEPSCFFSLGTHISVWKARGNVTTATGLCREHMPSEEAYGLCREGVISSYFLYYNDITQAYRTCDLDPDGRKECMKDFSKVYGISSYYPQNEHMCARVDEPFRTQCYQDMREFNITGPATP